MKRKGKRSTDCEKDERREREEGDGLSEVVLDEGEARSERERKEGTLVKALGRRTGGRERERNKARERTEKRCGEGDTQKSST